MLFVVPRWKHWCQFSKTTTYVEPWFFKKRSILWNILDVRKQNVSKVRDHANWTKITENGTQWAHFPPEKCVAKNVTIPKLRKGESTPLPPLYGYIRNSVFFTLTWYLSRFHYFLNFFYLNYCVTGYFIIFYRSPSNIRHFAD